MCIAANMRIIDRKTEDMAVCIAGGIYNLNGHIEFTDMAYRMNIDFCRIINIFVANT